jgi:hypothetical protein
MVLSRRCSDLHPTLLMARVCESDIPLWVLEVQGMLTLEPEPQLAVWTLAEVRLGEQWRRRGAGDAHTDAVRRSFSVPSVAAVELRIRAGVVRYWRRLRGGGVGD